MRQKSPTSNPLRVFRASELAGDGSGRGRSGHPESPQVEADSPSGKRMRKESSISLKARAVRYLSIREYSRDELFRKLAPYAQQASRMTDPGPYQTADSEGSQGRAGSDNIAAARDGSFDPDVLNALLDELEREGWQSDERFARSLEHTHRSRFGNRRIAYSMRERGLDDELIRESLDRLKDSEPQRAWEVWQKRFARLGLPTESREYARQARFLANRGFSAEIVSRILSGRYEPDVDTDAGSGESSG